MRKVKVKALRRIFEAGLFEGVSPTDPRRDRKHPVYRFMWKKFKKQRRVA